MAPMPSISVAGTRKIFAQAISPGSHVEHDRVAEDGVKGLRFAQVARLPANDDAELQLREDRIGIFRNHDIIFRPGYR